MEKEKDENKNPIVPPAETPEPPAAEPPHFEEIKEDEDLFAHLDRKAATAEDLQRIAVQEIKKSATDKAEEEKTPTPKGMKKAASTQGAFMITTTLDIAISKICSMFSGMEDDRYRLTEKQAKEHREVTAAYLEAMEINVSPTTIFVIITIALFGSSIFKAFQDKKQMQEEQDEIEQQAKPKPRPAPAQPQKTAIIKQHPATTKAIAKGVTIKKGRPKKNE